MANFAADREAMVERQIAGRGIHDERILRAFRTVPRELFVAQRYAHLAYSDQPLPIEAEQTISQPFIVAAMVEAGGIRQGDHVLEVGAGSGYAAAVISRIAGRVTAIERHGELAKIASRRLQSLGYDNVQIIHGVGSRGCAAKAPFDAILVAAAGHEIPAPLVAQLAPGGRLVMPVGEPDSVQRLVKVTKARDGRLEQSDLGPVRFVPLIGDA